MMFPDSERIKPILATQSFEFCQNRLSCSCVEGKKMSSGAANPKETYGGYKRRRADGVVVGVRGPREKRRKMECSSPVNTQTKHPASVRVLNQPLDPKALKKNPMDDEKRSRLDGVLMVFSVRGPRGKRRKMEGSPLLNAVAKLPASGRVFNQPLDPKALKKKPMDETLSPKKVSRAARRKSQKQINLVPLDHDNKTDPVKKQQEKGKFERIRQAEEKTKIKADEASAKKKTKVELKKQREREGEREAARIALQKMGRTAGIELNLEIYKELEILCGGSLCRGKPLHELGLFMKQEYLGDDDEEILKVKHGKILSSQLESVDGSRKNSPKAQPCRNSSDLPKKSKSSEEKVVKVDLNARVAENSVTLTSQMSKFDVPNSDERLLTPIPEAQMSPKKASRATMLKSRYADIIMKSQQQLDIVDPVKTQQEFEKLERSLAEDNAKIRSAEAAAEEKAKVELEKKREREREREAARIALQKMERTAGIELNLEIFKELELLSGCSLSRGKPMHELGLFIKQEYLGGDEEDEAILYDDLEEGEILPF